MQEDPLSPNSRTLAAYEDGAEAYLAQALAEPPAAYVAFRRRVLDLLPPGARMLELGTGPGIDADYFESHGVRLALTSSGWEAQRIHKAKGRSEDWLCIVCRRLPLD